MKITWTISVFAAFVCSTLVQAAPNFTTIDYYYEQLKDLGIDTRNHGPVCEYMARMQVEQEYPASEYDIQIGIVYRNDIRIVGELDLVIFRRSDGEAIVVGEVKCQRHLGRARHHAEDQLARFAQNIDHDQVRDMYLDHDRDQHFSVDCFDESPEAWTIGQQGAVASGFTLELELNLDDIRTLTGMLRRCQESDNC